eukprot:3971871-Karenia_brevis.AAC.1
MNDKCVDPCEDYGPDLSDGGASCLPLIQSEDEGSLDSYLAVKYREYFATGLHPFWHANWGHVGAMATRPPLKQHKIQSTRNTLRREARQSLRKMGRGGGSFKLSQLQRNRSLKGKTIHFGNALSAK